VVADQVPELEEDLGALRQRRLGPQFERVGGDCDGRVDVRLARQQ
jgi:hypothetical protein